MTTTVTVRASCNDETEVLVSRIDENYGVYALEQMMEEQRHDEGAAIEAQGCCGTCANWFPEHDDVPVRQTKGFCCAPLPAWAMAEVASPVGDTTPSATEPGKICGEPNLVGFYYSGPECEVYEPKRVMLKEGENG